MILITGAKGQLGTELRYLLDERGVDYVAADVEEMDITDSEKVEAFFAEVKPTIIYHCAAYTAVDAAEDEGKELNYKINVTGTENIAKAAAKYDAILVYISRTMSLRVKNLLAWNWKWMSLPIHRLNTAGPSDWVKKQWKNMQVNSTQSGLPGSLETMERTLSLPCKI